MTEMGTGNEKITDIKLFSKVYDDQHGYPIYLMFEKIHVQRKTAFDFGA